MEEQYINPDLADWFAGDTPPSSTPNPVRCSTTNPNNEDDDAEVLGVGLSGTECAEVEKRSVEGRETCKSRLKCCKLLCFAEILTGSWSSTVMRKCGFYRSFHLFGNLFIIGIFGQQSSKPILLEKS
jgi:hypothetical protein